MFSTEKFCDKETPDSFPLTHRKRFSQKVQDGFQRMKHLRVNICGLLRDVGDRMDDIIKKVEGVGNLFDSYTVFIVENDSEDNTREKLLEWSEKNPHVVILGCGINKEKCNLNLQRTQGHSVTRNRIEKMTHLRNIYLEYSKQVPSDYTIVWDMDVLGALYHDGLANTLSYMESQPSIDAMCSFGMYRFYPLNIYYDTYAHIEKGDTFHIDKKSLHDFQKGFLEVRYARGEEPREVVSCFSGFTVYRSKSIERVQYENPGDNLECEHVGFNRKLNKVLLNPSMIHLIMRND